MGFLDWLNSVPPISPPKSPLPESGPEKDAIEDVALHPIDEDGDGVPDTVAGICLTIEYCDAVGEISTRRVIVDRVYAQGEQLYLTGFCLLRNDQRTFRADRILKLLLPPEWKEIPNPIAFLQGYVAPSGNLKANWSHREDWQPQTERDPSYWERRYKVRSVANHGLRVLTFMARVDGAFDLRERDVLVSYVKNMAVVAGINLSEDEADDIASEADALFPTKRQVANSLAVIRLYQEQTSVFLGLLNRLVRVDGSISSWEVNAMTMLVEILKKQAVQAK